MKKIASTITACAIASTLTLASGPLAPPAQASVADGNYATCQSGTTVADFTGRDPSLCKTGYILYKDNKVVLHIRPTNKDVWKAFKNGYSAAQDWCKNNSLTCTVVTGVGVALVSPLINSATS